LWSIWLMFLVLTSVELWSYSISVRYEVFTEVLVKVRVFWGVTPCKLVNSVEVLEECNDSKTSVTIYQSTRRNTLEEWILALLVALHSVLLFPLWVGQPDKLKALLTVTIVASASTDSRVRKYYQWTSANTEKKFSSLYYSSLKPSDVQ
jgi:hypothetical protein